MLTRCEQLGVCQSIGCGRCEILRKLALMPVKPLKKKWYEAFSRLIRPRP